MNDQRGWSADPAISRLHRVVNWIEHYEREHPGTIPTNRMIAEGVALPVEDIIRTTTLLAARGLAKSADSMGPEATGVWLTAAGHDLVSTWRAARSSARQRRVACRDAVLDWFDEQSERVRDSSAFLRDVRASYYGEPFTPDEAQQAVSFLHGNGLIDGATVAEGEDVYNAKITDDGRVCVEQYGSTVADWMNRAQRGGDTITTITNSPGAQWMNESPAAQQTARLTTLSTDARRQVAHIADEIFIALDAVDLSPEQRQEAKAAATELRELAANPTAEKGRLRSSLGVIATAALGAMGTETGKHVLELIQQAMRAIGS
jgi:hypothetical protein